MEINRTIASHGDRRERPKSLASVARTHGLQDQLPVRNGAAEPLGGPVAEIGTARKFTAALVAVYSIQPGRATATREQLRHTLAL